MSASRRSAGTSTTMSASGTSTGGSARNRNFPSTKFVSFRVACRLVRRRARCHSGIELPRRHPGPLGRRGTQRIGVEARVPDVERILPRERRHGLAVRPHRSARDLSRHLRPEPPGAPGDRAASGQAVHIPLPWSSQGFVEIVEVEQELPRRRTRTHPGCPGARRPRAVRTARLREGKQGPRP